MVTSSATTAFAGGSVVAAGLGGLVGSGGTATGTGTSSMMGLGFEQVSQCFSTSKWQSRVYKGCFASSDGTLPHHGGFMPEVDNVSD